MAEKNTNKIGSYVCTFPNVKQLYETEGSSLKSPEFHMKAAFSQFVFIYEMLIWSLRIKKVELDETECCQKCKSCF